LYTKSVDYRHNEKSKRKIKVWFGLIYSIIESLFLIPHQNLLLIGESWIFKIIYTKEMYISGNPYLLTIIIILFYYFLIGFLVGHVFSGRLIVRPWWLITLYCLGTCVLVLPVVKLLGVLLLFLMDPGAWWG
jgi:hypothetical protein